MMDLDEELTLRIKTVFEDFDDGGSDMGWQMLSTKLPKEAGKQFPLYWVVGIAASVLIVFGLWFFKKSTVQTEEIQAKTEKLKKVNPTTENPVLTQKGTVKTTENKTQNPSSATDHKTEKELDKTNTAGTISAPQAQKIAKTNPAPVVKDQTNQTLNTAQTIQNPVKQNPIAQTKVEVQNNQAQVYPNLVSPNKLNQKAYKQAINLNVKPNLTTTTTVEGPKAMLQANPEQVAITKTENNTSVKPNLTTTTKVEGPKINQQEKNNPVIANLTVTDTTKQTQQIAVEIAPKKTTEEFLKEQSKIATAKNAQKKDKKEKRNSYEVFTGTFLNYYGDNDIKVNAGFGLNANLKVSKGLFLTVGAGVSQNKISYDNFTTASVSRSLQKADLSYATTNSNSGITLVQAGTITNIKLNAQLLSLDLPISLKFYPTRKQNFYVSTGFNSNSYFAQKYNYMYSVISTSSLSSSSVADREETEKSKFKGFEFANSAIFAFGINQKIGKTNILIFEPYFKPVLSSMGDKNLKINTIGLNLKFSFSNSTK